MNAPRRAAPPLACLLATVLLAGPAAAQQQVVKPPIARYWMDIATHSMAGMPEMPMMPMMPSLPLPGMGGATNAWGNTRLMSPGRWVDLALHTRERPAGTTASHAIPPGMRMGSALTLLPPEPSAPMPRDEPAEMGERPSGRILVYWGCGEAVRAGQPRVVDLATAGAAEFGRVLGGRYAPDRGARVGPDHALWPNPQNRQTVPRDASLVGEHAVSGDGVPASLRFAIGPAQDLMPPIQLASSGALKDSIALQWQTTPNASAYFLHAMGRVGNDMVLWSSAETPDTGMGLFDYLSNATVERWLREKVLLPTDQTRCAVPKGIFAGGREDGAMLRMIAYGRELEFVHPPRPQDPRKPWEPQWSARVRVKATTMAMLGMELDASARDSSAPAQTSTQAQEDRPLIPGMPSVPGAGKAIDALRGIFGR